MYYTHLCPLGRAEQIYLRKKLLYDKAIFSEKLYHTVN